MVIYSEIIFYLIFIKHIEKLILGAHSPKKLNHIDETECLRSNKKTPLHREDLQTHKITTTTQAQNIIKSGRFLGGGRPSDFMSTVSEP